MTAITREQIERSLLDYIEPHLEKNLFEAKALKEISISEGKVSLNVTLGFPNQGGLAAMKQALSERVGALEGVSEVVINVRTEIAAHKVAPGIQRLGQVKNVIAVASGKGGVGKSTTAVNLALALSEEGAKVGMLDADIYGPSLPRMLGAKGQPVSKNGKTVAPLQAHGVAMMSMGLLVDDEQPMVWRGPMATGALMQLLGETEWGELDYLVVDMPPGTGDIQLTLSQKVPLSGAVVVTTPQDIALLDARKGLKMFEKVKVPILGIVENMSMHVCSACGHHEAIFGQGGGAAMSEDYHVDLLGQLPLSRQVRELADGGTPSVVGEPSSKEAQIYRQTARNLAAKLSLRGLDYSNKFPNIVIQNT